MKQQQQLLPPHTIAWQWPVDPTRYDRTPILSQAERDALHRRFNEAPTKEVRESIKASLDRLLQPIEDVLTILHADANTRYDAIRVLLLEMHRRGTAFWSWSAEEWVESICESATTFALRYGRSCDAGNIDQARRYLALLSYLFHLPPDLDVWLHLFLVYWFARNVFGDTVINQVCERLLTVLQSWGYQQKQLWHFKSCVCYLMLRNRSPQLEDLDVEQLEAIDRTCSIRSVQLKLFQVSRALWALGMISRPLSGLRETSVISGTDGSIAEEWLAFCQRWRKQTTIQRRDGYYYPLLKVGRWLKVHHPEVSSPAQWSNELAAEFVAAVNDMKIGEWSDARLHSQLPQERIGHPLHATTKNRLLEAMRTFLRDCQEWGWIPVRLNPQRALRTPRPIKSLIGPNPRVIDKELWAKLLWAAMNLEPKDLPPIQGETTPYPFEMVRAVATVWCFAALRSNESARLRVGCIRWQHEDIRVPETGEQLPKDAICFLDIPVNKTVTAYTKPVHPLVGKRINEWERMRPAEQPKAVDRKTGEPVSFLFSYRGRRVSPGYINRFLIPQLCRKAGIPEQDSRGNITSHRARATIASMLYNAKEPLSVLELKEYLGHKNLASTQHYLKVDPTKLASRVAKAGYLEQNMATIEVLLDQEAILSGAAARGEVWKYYDLGHGFCTNTFWAECKHRMACARCPFYRPKTSTMEQLVEGKANLVRMLEFVQLTEDEKLLVTEGIELHQALLERLADLPTPAGPTPRELENSRQREAKMIPLTSVRRNKEKKQEEP